MSDAAAWRRHGLRALIVAPLLAVVLIALGPRAVTPFVPLYWNVSCQLLPGQRCQVDIAEDAGALGKIHLRTATTRIMRLADGKRVAAGLPAFAETDLSNALLPMFLVLLAITCWPASSLRQRLMMGLVGVVMLVLVQAITVPVLLAGTVEAALARLGGDERALRSVGDLWFLALQNGGVLMAGVLGALATALLVQPRRAPRTPAQTRAEP